MTPDTSAAPQTRTLQLLEDLVYILSHPDEFKKQKDALGQMLAEQKKVMDQTSEYNAKVKATFQEIAEERRKLEIARGDLVRERQGLENDRRVTDAGQKDLARAKAAFDKEQSARIVELRREADAFASQKVAKEKELVAKDVAHTQRTRELENREARIAEREAALDSREAAAAKIIEGAKRMAGLAQ